jgi:hypothetical protein
MNETPRPAPPNFVPTLTEVVRPEPVGNPVLMPLAMPAEFANLLQGWPDGLNASASPFHVPPLIATDDLALALLERILQRVELSLASRLQATVDSVVEAQMQSFKVALRAQISATVLDAVKQAVEQETAATQPEFFSRK